MWNLKKVSQLVTELRRLPRVAVTLSGNLEAERLYRQFTRPHPRYRLIRNKTWGVGLLKLPPDSAAYLRGREMQAVRTNRSKALAAGFRFEIVRARDYFSDVYDVNASLDQRQGRQMDSGFVDRDRVRAYCDQAGQLYAVLDREGRLRGYAHVIVAGEVALLNRLLGHGADLDKGIMYLCLSEIVRVMCEFRAASGSPLWLMYDTIFGAERGLRYFKERLGFKPYHVRWKWTNHGGTIGSAADEQA